MTTVAGVDGHRAGWVAIVLGRGRFARAHVAATMDALLPALADAAVIGVDIPIGLVDRGARACDAAAKARLGRQAASVFAIPPRRVLAAPTYAEANRRARAALGHGVSKQAYLLRAKILDVDRHAGDRRLHEVHPELSFRALAGRALPGKKTWTGQAARRAALASAGIVLPDELGPAGAVPPDDVLDAAAVAWTAARLAAGTAVSVPDPPTQRGAGRAIAIWV